MIVRKLIVALLLIMVLGSHPLVGERPRTWSHFVQERGMARPNFSHKVTVHAIFQNEARWLKEWIEYHRLIGVDHFLLYNHRSTDGWWAVLSPYIQEGIVEVVQWSSQPQNIYLAQRRAQDDALRRLRSRSRWVAFIDTDEFIVPVQGESLPELLADFEQYGGVVVNWRQFGTSGVRELEPDELLIERLVWAERPKGWLGRMVKSIVQPSKTKQNRNPHWFDYLDPYFAVDTDGKRIDGPSNRNGPNDRLVINHYYTRTVDWMLGEKTRRAMRRVGVLVRTEEEQLRHLLQIERETNLVEDRTIHRYLPRLKERMK